MEPLFLWKVYDIGGKYLIAIDGPYFWSIKIRKIENLEDRRTPIEEAYRSNEAASMGWSGIYSWNRNKARETGGSFQHDLWIIKDTSFQRHDTFVYDRLATDAMGDRSSFQPSFREYVSSSTFTILRNAWATCPAGKCCSFRSGLRETCWNCNRTNNSEELIPRSSRLTSSCIYIRLAARSASKPETLTGKFTRVKINFLVSTCRQRKYGYRFVGLSFISV